MKTQPPASPRFPGCARGCALCEPCSAAQSTPAAGRHARAPRGRKQHTRDTRPRYNMHMVGCRVFSLQPTHAADLYATRATTQAFTFCVLPGCPINDDPGLMTTQLLLCHPLPSMERVHPCRACWSRVRRLRRSTTPLLASRVKKDGRCAWDARFMRSGSASAVRFIVVGPRAAARRRHQSSPA